MGTKGTKDKETLIYQESDKAWLKIEAFCYKPLETASELNVVTNPTHGRRYHLATENVDYSKEGPFSTDQLIQLKEFPSPKNLLTWNQLMNTVGISKFMGERGRKVAGATLGIPYVYLKKEIVGENQPTKDDLDSKGMVFVDNSSRSQFDGFRIDPNIMNFRGNLDFKDNK